MKIICMICKKSSISLRVNNLYNFSAFISQIKPKTNKECISQIKPKTIKESMINEGHICKKSSISLRVNNWYNYSAFVSQIKPKSKESVINESRVHDMQEELNNFKRNEIWDLVLCQKTNSNIYKLNECFVTNK